MKKIVLFAASLLLLVACNPKEKSTEQIKVEVTEMQDSITSSAAETVADTTAQAPVETVVETPAPEQPVEQPVANQPADNGDVEVEITTSMGEITVRLYGDTPIHRDNFVKLVREGYYDGVLFHRVINNFMVQAGDPNSKNAPAGKMLGDGDPGYTLEAEFVYPKYFHKRGALAAARTGDAMNPQRRSSGSQFYIVTGQVYKDQQLKQMEQQLGMAHKQDVFNRIAAEHREEIMQMRRNRDSIGLMNLQEQVLALTEAECAKNPVGLTQAQREAYSTVGGTPHLDGQYTVFGEVVKGMDVVDAIQNVATDRNDRPNEDVKVLSAKVVE